MKRLGKIIIAILGLGIVLAVGFVIAVAITSKGEIEPFYDENGEILENSIAERVFVDINGRSNGMIIRGKSLDNPVILFISGGPGVPQYWMNEAYAENYPNKLEDEYTVCWWEYAGEGMSYDRSIKSEEITIERLSEDAVAVANYLRERFGKEKIYLMAHSAGTPLGIYLAQEKSEPFYAYFAMGQIANEGNRRYEDGYIFMKEQFEKDNNQKALSYMNTLIKEENGELTIIDKESIRSKWEQVLLMAGCATTREMRSDAFEIFFPQIFTKCYTLKEKINFWIGKAFMLKTPYDDYEVPLTNPKPAQIPVYFISGYYDYTTPVTIVEDFYKNLEAPDKELYIFNDSAHSPLWEENEAVLEVIREHAK